MRAEDIEDFYTNVLTENERAAVEVALLGDSPWSSKSFSKQVEKELDSIKDKIKQYHLPKVKHKCCYCRRSLHDATIEQDREHVIPKGKCKDLTYNIFNISISCKRCNMGYKKERVDHITDMIGIENDYVNPDRYLIPHPNIDKYTDHLVRKASEDEDFLVCSYEIRSDKGQFLYDFLSLEKLCVNEIDMAQGGKIPNDDIASSHIVNSSNAI